MRSTGSVLAEVNRAFAGGAAPLATTPKLAIPELKALQELRRALAHGGLPALDKRTFEDHARIGSFRVQVELIHFLDDYRRRIEGGERCRIVEREHRSEPGRLLIELHIEVMP